MQTSLMGMQSMLHIGNERLDRDGYEGRRVMGYKLPDWQRPLTWTTEQCVRFIESIWLGVNLGTFIVNETASDEAIDRILLDGQQRLSAIERYWGDGFPIVGEDGSPYLWSDLTQEEHNHFLRISFPWIETRYRTEQECRLAYDRHNFGGTAHTEDQRAVKPGAL